MESKLKKLMNGKRIQFKHGELENLPHEIFGSKNSKAIMKAHMKGMGVRIQLDDENEVQALGGKIGFKKVGKAFKSVKKTLGDTEKMKYGKNAMKVMNFQNKMSQGIAKATSGIPLVGKATSLIADGNEKLTGFANDVHRSRKDGGSGAKILKRAIGRTARREGEQYLKDKINEYQGQAKDYVRGQARDYIKTQADAYLGGSFRGNGIHIAGGAFHAGSFRPNGGAIYGGKVYDDQSPFLRADQSAFFPLKPQSLRSQKGI